MFENPVVWEASRIALDLAFGLYRRRLQVLEGLGAVDGDTSLLDVGCGIGQYAKADVREYVGIDLDPRYIAYAQRRRGGGRKSFRCADVSTLADETKRFDTVLAVDLLHHLDDDAVVLLLRECARLATKSVVVFEPVREQHGRLGRWIIKHDRGDHMRTLASLRELLAQAPLTVVEDRELVLGPITTRVVRAAPKVTSDIHS